MTKKLLKALSVLLALAVGLLATGGIVLAEEAAAEEDDAMSFAEQFRSPEDNDAKPYMRWWIAPGRMDEEITRQEIRNFAAAGYGGVELISLELTSVQMNSEGWNEVMMWIFDEAGKNDMKVDVTLGEFWPIATERIAIEDRYTDPRAEQTIYIGAADFAAAEAGAVFEVAEYPFPPTYEHPWTHEQVQPMAVDQPWTLVAVTAAKKAEGGAGYDAASAVVLTDGVDMGANTAGDHGTGKLSFTAPEAGDWTVFYVYQQATGKFLSFGVDSVVVDHLSSDATNLIIQDFEEGFENTPGLKDLYRQVGGYFFGDSLELSRCTVWTGNMLEEFKARRGYDLTPYLPAVYALNGYNDATAAFDYDFADDVGLRVRMDYGQTISELIAENHLGVFRDWAHSELDMGLRYQSHIGAMAFYYDASYASLATDISETESYGMGDNMDSYLAMSAVSHMKNRILSAEAAESTRQDWRQTWTGSYNLEGSREGDMGFMYYTNRMFAAGVNKLIFHGASAKFNNYADQPDVGLPPAVQTWPGHAFMAGMQYSNEWDDKTPLWENTPEMINYLTRAQFVLQQGQGDIDLAFWRVYTTQPTDQAAPREVNNAGYTYDYVSEAVLELDNAVTGEEDGRVVLAPEGPSYKALILDQRRRNDTVAPYMMSLDAAKKLNAYADAGLPIVIIGEAPDMVNGCDGAPEALGEADAELKALMAQLLEKDSVVAIADRDALLDTLAQMGIVPDAQPDAAATNMFYHRAAEDADYYFVANDSLTDAVTQTVSFTGEGRPYLLDAWTGEITPIARYTTEDGKVTVAITVAPEAQKLIAIAGDDWAEGTAFEHHVVDTDADAVVYNADGSFGVRALQAGEYTVTLEDGTALTAAAEAPEAPINLNGQEWTMVMHAWQPLTTPDDAEDNNFLKTKIVDSEPYTITALVPWNEIDPENLSHIGGVAEYATSFDLAEGWAEGQGATIEFDRVTDTLSLTVNGNPVIVDEIALSADIGQYLVAGTNEIVVKVASNLANYKYGLDDATTFQFGIIGDVTVTPYRQVNVEA